MLKRVLLAIDGSPGSKKAADHARHLLDSPDTELTILVAVEPPTATPIAPFESFAMTPAHPSPERMAEAQKLIDALEAELGYARVHARVEIGPAADVICAVAESIDADVIVMGARGLNPAVKWLLGSVSDKVIRHASRPVTIVR